MLHIYPFCSFGHSIEDEVCETHMQISRQATRLPTSNQILIFNKDKSLGLEDFVGELRVCI